jgi:hypothetical protein
MMVRREMAEWRATSAASESRVTCEPCPCQSRCSRQSRLSRLSQASAIAVEAFMNNAGLGRQHGGERLEPADPQTAPCSMPSLNRLNHLDCALQAHHGGSTSRARNHTDCR